ncbi:MAG: ABC transporter transmembrane domain-containing protein, partial [Janthinobacterium sp.]
MSTHDAAPADSKQAGPIRRILHPIRGRLIAAAMLAASGSMLTLVPLAGIAHVAQIALDPALAQGELWPTIIASVACLFAGMALMSLGELAAHLADNRLTHQLRLQAMQRLGQVPLGWFTSRASGEVKQAMQDDINTLHSLTAHFYTTTGRAVGAIAISVIYLFAMDWRLALIAILPFPGFFLFFGRAMKASSGNMAQFVAGMGRINNAVVEFVNGIPVVKAFGATGRAHGSYRAAVDAFADAFSAFTRPLVGSMANANALIAPVAVLGVVVLAGTVFVALGAMAPVDVLPFALVAPGISAPMLLLHYLTHDLNNATGAA